MSLGNLPTELLHAICQAVSQGGTNDLVRLTRASRLLHDISNPMLYATDVRDTGGVISMCFGLASKRISVIKLCLSAGCRPDVRIETCNDLGAIFDTNLFQGDALNFFMSFSRHLQLARYGFQPFRRDADNHRGGLYLDSERDGNMPFRSVDSFYWTPLHVAVLRNDVELLALLLDHGADPNAAGRGVCQCYHQRLRRTVDRFVGPESEDVVPMLERSRFGLPHAIESDNEVVGLAQQYFQAEPVLLGLFRTHPDVISTVTPRFDPLPPLHVAVERFESLEQLERLYNILKCAGCLDGAPSDVDGLDAFGDTPFSVAVFSGKTETFGTWLRDRGADINFALHDANGDRCSILNALCKSGQHSDALLLMDMGVDINRDAELSQGRLYESTMHLCCGWLGCLQEWPVEDKLRRQRDAIAILKRLVHAGADVNARAVGGMTPLMSAAALGFPAAVRVLLEGKPDLRAENASGKTALHYAVVEGLGAFPGPQMRSALTIIRLLLDNGADPNQHSAGRSAPPLFQGEWGAGVMPGADPRKFWSDATRETEPSTMASIGPLLIERGADPNIYLDHHREADELRPLVAAIQGHSLPMTAFFNGEFDCLDSLVACGTIITYQDYLLMMSSLLDPRIRSRGSKSGAVQALFRILNGPFLRLEKAEDRKSIMDAWTELLILSVGERPSLVHVVAPHFSITNKVGYAGRTALHVLAQ
ncbi:hypothetical protein DHEL01_v211666 [Diaporthe helianthi]|uniref:Uncharacterized protein n=1 Tax=Diaporthe helianthi TaxID=158607 RepID=A0A2P5HI60_DIAHE|nr:hypothetical protein DHEL01_v211666 [Diaporthe helianthi]